MKGTEKQIEWAESIVKKMTTFTNIYCDWAIEEKGISEETANNFREASLNRINAMDNAGNIIDCFKDVAKKMGELTANWKSPAYQNFDGRVATVMGDWKYQTKQYRKMSK